MKSPISVTVSVMTDKNQQSKLKTYYLTHHLEKI